MHSMQRLLQSRSFPALCKILNPAQKNDAPCVRSFYKKSVEKPVFQPRRIAIVTKTTRYEYEKILHPHLSEDKLKATLEERGSDYFRILQRYKTHVNNLKQITQCLQSLDIESRIVTRAEYTQDVVDWADAVMSAGGDGTFLLAASKIKERTKPLIGLNTDPDRSEGYMCLPKYSCRAFPAVMELLTSGKFKWSWRQRIRVTMSGKHDDDDPISLRDRCAVAPEDRYGENEQEDDLFSSGSFIKPVRPERVLPVLALNEVFFGEQLSSKVSYYEISLDDSVAFKQKSSGVTISTGTGSTGWLFNINQLSSNDVEMVLRIAGYATGMPFPVDNLSLIKKITNVYNDKLRFDPSELKMAYTIRDPIVNGIFEVVADSKGFAKKVTLKSRMWDACLVIDGGAAFKFNDGATATLEIFEEDALRTVSLDGVPVTGFVQDSRSDSD